jgi:hypothetical protein
MNTTTIPTVDFPIMEAVLPDHPYFEGVEVDADNIVLAIDGSVGMGRVSFIEAIDLGSGTLIAQTIEGYPWIAEWPAGVEFYEGSGQVPAATRVMFSTGTQEIDSNVDPQGAHNLTADGEQILRNIIAALVPAKLSDITAPGDIVVGVPYQPETDWNDVGWPPNENPSLCIDNNSGTKYLHFAGDIQSTGVQITPLDGPSVVTGITLTTANDAPERDPITYELYGSNGTIDGPYELIADGNVVDFAGEAAWPRYTINATPITFDNDKSYAHYQLMFPTVRDPEAQNSMQIAEIELLGVLGEGAPGGLMYDGDSLEGWDHDNNSDAWDGTGPGEGAPGGAALMTEDDVTFVRIQDTGDPRGDGFSDPSNRKVYLTKQIERGLDGAHLELKLRVATTPPLDNQAGGEPWPEGGIGYHIRDGGKGMVGIAEDGVGQLAFSLAKAGEIEGLDTDALVVNGLVGTEMSDDVDNGDSDINAVAIDDATAWNTITVDIAAGGAGTHVLTISVNGGDAVSVEVTTGASMDGVNNYVAIGSSGTGGITAFDVDYISVE